MPERSPFDSHATRPPADWVVLRTAPDQLTAELWRGLLEAEEIPAMLAPADAVSFLGVSAMPCRLLVPPGLLSAAETVLAGELWAAEGGG